MNKKTITSLMIVVLAILGGVAWYYWGGEKNSNQPAAIIDTENNQDNNAPDTQINPEVLKITADDFVLGNPEAPVTIIEYSNHFCIHCTNFYNNTLPIIIEKYISTGKVNLVSRYVSPPEIGQALYCANDEGKFKEFSDYIFEHNTEIKSVDALPDIAVKIGLNKDNFNQCLTSKKYEAKVNNWYTSAQSAGVQYTPTFFVSGKQIVGNQPFDVFEKNITEALANAGE